MSNSFLPPDAVPFTNAYNVDVTPELAKSWLETGKSSRTVSEDHVDKLAVQMKGHMWLLNHNGIAFAEDGTILDGLHRLHAVVRSGETIPMIVVVNEPLENTSAIDNRYENK